MFVKLLYFLLIHFVVFDNVETTVLYQQWLELQQIKCVFKSILSPGSRNSDESNILLIRKFMSITCFLWYKGGSVIEAITIYSIFYTKCSMLLLAPCRAVTADESHPTNAMESKSAWNDIQLIQRATRIRKSVASHLAINSSLLFKPYLSSLS